MGFGPTDTRKLDIMRIFGSLHFKICKGSAVWLFYFWNKKPDN